VQQLRRPRHPQHICFVVRCIRTSRPSVHEPLWAVPNASGVPVWKADIRAQTSSSVPLVYVYTSIGNSRRETGVERRRPRPDSFTRSQGTNYFEPIKSSIIVGGEPLHIPRVALRLLCVVSPAASHQSRLKSDWTGSSFICRHPFVELQVHIESDLSNVKLSLRHHFYANERR